MLEFFLLDPLENLSQILRQNEWDSILNFSLVSSKFLAMRNIINVIQCIFLIIFVSFFQYLPIEGNVGGYPIKFLEQIVRLSKCLKKKRELIGSLRDLNAQGTIYILRKQFYSTKLNLTYRFFKKTWVSLSKPNNFRFNITF